MNKNKWLLLFILFLFPINIYALNYPKLDSKIIEVYDVTDGKILYEVNSKKSSSIASLTKIATVITAIENIKNVDEKVTITKEILSTVSWDASVAGLKIGDVVTYKDLLYASMLPSGADATQSIAILSSGSVDNFVEKMNKLAEKIELKNTHFVNVTGLDADGHYSTADDMRKLLVYALKNNLFKEIYTTKDYTLSNGLKVKTTLYKYSSSKKDIEKILGSKTGYTGNAGYCLSSLSNINSHEMIILVLNANHVGNDYYNIIDTKKLINFLNSNYKDELLVKKGTLIKQIPVVLSDIDTYDVITSKDVLKYLPSDYNKDDLRIEFVGKDELSYKNKKGDNIGIINYYFKDELFLKENIMLDVKLNLNVFKLLKKYLFLIVIIVVALILLIGFILRKKLMR